MVWLTIGHDFDCAELPASTNHTIGVTHAPAINLNLFGLGLAEFINLECDFNAASTASETVTTIQNENEIKMKFVDGQDGSQTPSQTYPTTPVIDSDDKIDPTIIRLLEINTVRCVVMAFYVKINFIIMWMIYLVTILIKILVIIFAITWYVIFDILPFKSDFFDGYCIVLYVFFNSRELNG